jgi:hypothetical protein
MTTLTGLQTRQVLSCGLIPAKSIRKSFLEFGFALDSESQLLFVDRNGGMAFRTSFFENMGTMIELRSHENFLVRLNGFKKGVGNQVTLSTFRSILRRQIHGKLSETNRLPFRQVAARLVKREFEIGN